MRSVKTLMLVDLCGFTSLSTAGNRDLIISLAQFVEKTVSEVTGEQKGDVFKKAGDAVLAAFNSSRNAILAAIAVLERIQTNNKILEADFKVKIAIATGEVFSYQGEYFGSGILAIFAMEKILKADDVLLAESTYETLRGHKFPIVREIDKLFVENFGYSNVYRLLTETEKEAGLFSFFTSGEGKRAPTLISPVSPAVRISSGLADIWCVILLLFVLPHCGPFLDQLRYDFSKVTIDRDDFSKMENGFEKYTYNGSNKVYNIIMKARFNSERYEGFGRIRIGKKALPVRNEFVEPGLFQKIIARKIALQTGDVIKLKIRAAKKSEFDLHELVLVPESIPLGFMNPLERISPTRFQLPNFESLLILSLLFLFRTALVFVLIRWLCLILFARTPGDFIFGIKARDARTKRRLSVADSLFKACGSLFAPLFAISAGKRWSKLVDQFSSSQEYRLIGRQGVQR